MATLKLPAPRTPAPLFALWRELRSRQPQLARFGALLLVLLAVALVAGLLDPRTIRGVGLWVKPAKFMASLVLFAWTTAWLVGLLPPAARRGRTVKAVVVLIVAAGSFEIGYITLQAALGQASHYNGSTALHQLLYGLMGAGALTLTATQGLLAWRIAREPAAPTRGAAHAPEAADDEAARWRLAVVLGLWGTFVLGAGAGMVLGGLQPPAGAGLPLVGWHLGGDLRPAHFVGLHSHQALPLAALMLRRRRGVWAFAAGWLLLWAVLMGLGLLGAVPTPLPPYDGRGS
jgi:hypothetical protein